MKNNLIHKLVILIFFVFFTINIIPSVSAHTIEAGKAYQISAQQNEPEAGTVSHCAVCEQESVFVHLCTKHLIVAAILLAVLVLNFIRIKNPAIKMIINSLALLMVILVFISLYSTKMFTEAKVCLGVMLVYVVLWVVSIIKTMSSIEDKKPRSKRSKK